MFRKMDKNERLVFHPSNGRTTPKPKLFSSIGEFPMKAGDITQFFHIIKLNKGSRDRMDGFNILFRIQCDVLAISLKERIMPSLWKYSARMESTAIWDNILANISWVVCGHPDFMYCDDVKDTIVKGLVDLPKKKEQKAELGKIENEVGFDYAPSMVVRKRSITHNHKGTEIQTSALMISARNPYKNILKKLMLMLNKDIIGKGIFIIPYFDYEQSEGEAYTTALIRNNDFQNSHTGLEIYNIVAELIDEVGQKIDVILPQETTLRQLLLEKGVLSIERTVHSKRTGKYMCIVPHDKYDSIQSSIKTIFTSLGGGWRERCYAKYRAYPSVEGNQQLNEYAVRNEKFILESIEETVECHKLPKETDLASLLNNNTARNSSRSIKKPRQKRQMTVLGGLGDVTCTHTNSSTSPTSVIDT